MIKGFINIIIYIFFPGMFTLIFTNDINSKEFILYSFISYLLLSIFYIIKYKTELKKYLKNFDKKYLKTIFLYEVIGFTIMILSNYIINYIIIPNGISSNELANRELLLNNKFIYSIILCILIPFLEEIIFRLEFKKNIKNKYIFILVSSLTFAILHILSITKYIELLYIIPYLTLGLTFTLIYQKTENIISNIIAHIIHNTIIVFIILLF